MPSRSFYTVPDFEHIEAILLDSNGPESAPLLLPFREAGVAPLLDAGSLPRCIGIGTPTFFSILRRKNKHYRRFSLPKKSGGARDICTPRTYLKVIQWWILDNILYQANFPEYVTGFVRGQSPISNARRHVGHAHILNMDLKSFFPSIRIEKVRNIFREFNYGETIVEQLAQLTTLDDALPQGAPTSPCLANLATLELDKALATWAAERQLCYSRYADDLTFSSDDKMDQKIPEEVQKIVRQFDLFVNTQKTRFAGPGDRMEVTGLIINAKVQRPRSWRNRVRAIFHQAEKNPQKYVELESLLHGYRGALVDCDSNEKLVAAGNVAIEAVRQFKIANGIGK
jgi:RNA-directed DNA polymerase